MALASLLVPAVGGDAVDSVMGGAAMGDPMTAAMISAGSNVLGKALAPSSAGPSRADSGGQNWTTLDNSGWTVATGGAKAEGSRGLDVPAWALIAVAVVVSLAWVRRKKS